MGVEPDPEAVKGAQAEFGLNVFHGTLEEACLQSGYFDAITMNHVIEHLADPVGTLKECCRVLKPGGELVIVPPNIVSLGHKIFTRGWGGLEPPRHLYLFSPGTLSACAQRAGLNVQRLGWLDVYGRLAAQYDETTGLSNRASSLGQICWNRVLGCRVQVVPAE